MTDHVPDELEPAGRDLRAYTDHLRPNHPVVRNTRHEWVLLRHPDVMAAALDPVRFSSAGSAHLHVPNGLDGVEHRAARQTLDRYFEAAALAPFEPSSMRWPACWWRPCPAASRWTPCTRSAPRSQSAPRAPGWAGPPNSSPGSCDG